MDELQIELLASEINSCVRKAQSVERNEQLLYARSLLDTIRIETRMKIVTHTFEGRSPLFLSCLLGKADMVSFLLDECGADIEQKGIYEVIHDHDTDARHEVTPLWCAAVSNKLDIVQILIDHAANINSVSDSLSTPVRSACYMSNLEIVKTLVEHGADIHKPNVNGGTCLINSVQSVPLCKFLIDKGCDVNARDCADNLALHYAVREGRLPTTKLLLESGSDPYAVNSYGEDAFNVAALRGWKHILDYLIEAIKPDKIQEIECYELFGAHYIDEHNNFTKGLHFMKIAAAMRLESLNLLPKKIPESTQSAYMNYSEAITADQYGRMTNPNEIYMQSLLTRERILGTQHKETLFGIMYRGAVYADSNEEQKCVSLWLYALELRHKYDRWGFDCDQTLLPLTKLISEIQYREPDYSVNVIKYSDLCSVLNITIQQIKAMTALTNTRPVCLKHLLHVSSLMKISLYLISFLIASAKTENMVSEARLLTEMLVQINPKDEQNNSLLHLVLLKSTSELSREFYGSYPNMTVLKWLLECGACVDSRNDVGNTPFLAYICGGLTFNEDITLCSENEMGNLQIVIRLLFEIHGAHPDTKNYSLSRESLSRLIQTIWKIIRIDLQKHCTLKCWAARVIKDEGILYRNELPQSLIDFIDLH